MKKSLFGLVCIFISVLSVNALESKYSLADDGYNVPVRDQKNTDACWAFASTESIMSNMYKKGLSVQTFSPSHIGILTQDTNNINGFKTFHRDLKAGGNFDLSSAYVMNGWGPVLESEAPFDSYLSYLDNQTGINIDSYKNIKPNVSVYDIAIVDNAKGACSDSSINQIKNYIKQHGAIAAMVHWYNDNDLSVKDEGEGTYSITGTYINKEYYYYDKNDEANHAITIVGWDDNVLPTNYIEGHRPQRNGAWIVKNSWGESESLEFSPTLSISVLRGDNGYYYIPYDDYNICSYWTGFYNVSNKVSDYNYYYDYLGANAYSEGREGVEAVYFANKYSKLSEDNEKVDRVSFYTDVPGVSYEVFYSSTGSLNSYQSIGSGVFEYPGYTSVIPNKEIVVSDNFSLIVKYTYPDGSIKKVPFGKKIDDEKSFYYTYDISGQNSYVSYDGANWSNLASQKVVVPVRVYTSVTNDGETNAAGEIATTPTQGNEPVIGEIQETDVNNNTEVIDKDVIPKNDTNSNSTPNASANDQVTDKINEGEVENPKTGSSFSWLIIIAMVLCILGVFGYTRNKKFYRL